MKPAVIFLLLIAFPASAAAPEGGGVRVFDLRPVTGKLLLSDPEGVVFPPEPELGSNALDLSGLVPHAGRGVGVGNGLEPQSFAAAEIESAVRRLIAPDSWTRPGNRLELRGNGAALLAVNEEVVLQAISAFLADLESRCSASVEADLALVPPSALEAVAPGWSEPGASPWLAPESLERAVAKGGERAASISTGLSLGVVRPIGPSGRSRHLTDYEANQTGTVPVLCPIVGQRFAGTYVEALALEFPQGEWLRVDLRLGRLERPEVLEKRKLPFGELEFLRQSQEDLRTSVVLPRGKTMVLGALCPAPSGGGAEGVVGLLRVRSRQGPRAAPATAAPHTIDVRLWQVPFPPRRSLDEGISFSTGPDPQNSRLPAQGLVDSLLEKAWGAQPSGSLDLLAPCKGAIFLAAPSEAAGKLEARLAAEALEAWRLVRVDLWEGLVEDREFGGEAAPLDPRWQKLLTGGAGFRVRVLGQAGASVSLAAISSRSYLSHAEAVCGGTDKTIEEVTDPLISSLGNGVKIVASVDLLPEGLAFLELQGGLSGARVERRGRTRVAAAAPVLGAETSPKQHTGSAWLDLELPEVESESWEHRLIVPLGRTMLLSARPAPQPGRTAVRLVLVESFPLRS